MNQIAVNLIVGSSLLLSFLVFLNPNKYNKQGNKWLSLCLFCLFLFLLNIDEFLLFNNIDTKKFHLYIFSLYIVTPIFYLTIVYFVNPTKKWKPIYYLHFIFGLFFVLFEQNSTTLKDNEIHLLSENISQFSHYTNLFLMNVVLPLQAIFYISFSYIEIKKHEKNINQFSSNTNDINLKWLKQIVYYIVFLGTLFVVHIFTNSIHFLNFALLICLFFIGYSTIKQKEIFPFPRDQKVEIIEIIQYKSNNEIEKKKLLSDEKLLKIKNKLIQIMELKKPFLNSDITLILLANQIDVSAHLLSYVINEGFNENFNQFINRYRIDESKKLILDPKKNNLSILGIGYEVGFNSKSVFNSTFKKITGCSPIQYKNKNLLEKTSTEL